MYLLLILLLFLLDLFVLRDWPIGNSVPTMNKIIACNSPNFVYVLHEVRGRSLPHHTLKIDILSGASAAELPVSYGREGLDLG